MKHPAARYILVAKCSDRKAIVAAATGCLADSDASITESNRFSEAIDDQFNMPIAFREGGPRMPQMDMLRDGFRPIAHRFDMARELHDVRVRPKVLSAGSKTVTFFPTCSRRSNLFATGSCQRATCLGRRIVSRGNG